MKYIILFASLISLFFVACDDKATEPANTQEISGFILNSNDEPVQNAEISVTNSKGMVSSDSSDESGYFTLKALPINIDDLQAEIKHKNFADLKLPLKDLVKENNQDEGLKIHLLSDDSCCNVVNITVKSEYGEKLSGVEVKLNKDDDLVSLAETNEDGTVSFDGICEGDYWLRLFKEGYEVEEEDFEFETEDCDTLNLIFELDDAESDDDTCCTSKLQVRVLKSDSEEAIKEAKVRVWYDDEMVNYAYTDEAGYATIENLCDEDYMVDIVKEGYAGIEFEVEFECDEEIELTKELSEKSEEECCDNILKVKAVDEETGEVISDAKLRLWKDGDMVKYAYPNESGWAVIEGICKGSYGVDIISDDYEDIEFEIEFDCEETKEYEKQMTALDGDDDCCGVMLLTIVDNNEEPVKGAKVQLGYNGEYIEYGYTNENGKIIFDDELCNGNYWIRVTKDGYDVLEKELSLDGDCDTLEYTAQINYNNEEECCNNILKVKAVDEETGEVIKDAKLRLWKDGDMIEYAYPNESGWTIIDGICKGSYGVDIISDEYEDIEFMVEFDCEETKEFEKQMEKD